MTNARWPPILEGLSAGQLGRSAVGTARISLGLACSCQPVDGQAVDGGGGAADRGVDGGVVPLERRAVLRV